jgi:hypothetical protein
MDLGGWGYPMEETARNPHPKILEKRYKKDDPSGMLINEPVYNEYASPNSMFFLMD